MTMPPRIGNEQACEHCKPSTPNVRIVKWLCVPHLAMRMQSMPDAENLLDESEIRSFLSGLAFFREFSIDVVSLEPGFVTVELPFDERFSGPPHLFPASMVGTAGDVAAVAS